MEGFYSQLAEDSGSSAAIPERIDIKVDDKTSRIGARGAGERDNRHLKELSPAPPSTTYPSALRIAEMLVNSAFPSAESARYVFDGISHQDHNPGMSWEIEASDEFIAWYKALTDDEMARVATSVEVLERSGPDLGRPQVDTLKGSKIPNLKELRIQHEGRPIRVLFVFDPRRVCYLILGGDKTGDNRWYERFIPLAEGIYERHLREIGR